MGDGLIFHYTNPKFSGLPWAVDRKPKPKKKHKKNQRLRKKQRQTKLHNPRENQCKEFLKNFWPRFELCPTTAMRLSLLKSAAWPGWDRVSEELRKYLRRQYAHRYPHLLANIDEHCGVCGNYVWREKHHIVPLSHGGMNINENLIAICIGCHKEIHPWI